MLRGGSWNNNARNARAAYRNNNRPDNFDHNNGFRLALARVSDDSCRSSQQMRTHATPMTSRRTRPPTMNQRGHVSAEAHGDHGSLVWLALAQWDSELPRQARVEPRPA
jgi:hypothetical protein